ncbi:N,N-dimethylformamidase beta subunit family domain-containing protein [Streptomyces sp. CS62]|uniref:N,N-dimethylformamidase beta subunit family domain-containing protein n=1 Tax=Streptomyces sp. CS62 TaxID=3119268 RepID=UPI002F95ADA5
MKDRTRLLRYGLFTVVAALLATVLPPSAVAGAADPCGPAANAIVCENSKPGTPMPDWFAPSAYGDIKGFTSRMSVQAGDTVQFKVQSPTPYRVSVYRLGHYGGDGARLMSTAAQAAQTHPANVAPGGSPAACTTKPATGLVDCGNWPVTATWTVPADAVSGLYLANFDQADGNGVMPYPFVVRNDASRSDIVVQTSDQTWQAYNNYGGQDLYDGAGPAPDGRAYEVSYNRPMDIGGENGIYGSEYQMIAWLERNGYDVSYISGIDMSTRGGTLLRNHKVFMSSGHDEYWTQEQFTHALEARKTGLHQTYFSGNEIFSGRPASPPASTAPARPTGPSSATRRPSSPSRSRTASPTPAASGRAPSWTPPAPRTAGPTSRRTS